LHVRREGNVIQVHVQVPETMSGIGIFYASLDLQVQVPAGLPVEITDSSGDMTLDGVRVVRLQDSSGDISRDACWPTSRSTTARATSASRTPWVPCASTTARATS
jgi:hypothetical protein